MPTNHIPTYLSEKHAHPRDQHISFQEEGHVYTVLGQTDYTSVTTFIHSHFRHFDAEGTVNKILQSTKYHNDPSYKYYQKSKEEILAGWSEKGVSASQRGTQTHYHIELFYNQEPVEDTSKEYEYFLQFYHDHPHLQAYRTEYLVYMEEYKISGSIDMVFQNPDGTFCIYDWKRIEEIKYEPFGNQYALTECIQHLPDVNFTHYSLQLSLYRYMLETKYDMVITDLCLVILHPNHYRKTYEKVPVPYLKTEIMALLAYWKQTYIDTGKTYQKPEH